MISKLEMFIALAKEKHFGRAAAQLGITQPTLSAGIQQLEGQLGVMLVFRGSRYGGLTPEGQRALVWARQIVADTKTFRAEMRAAREGLSGDLRLGVIPTALTWAARLSAEFSESHPNVRFKILSRTSIEILSMIENLEIDAGISYLNNEPLGQLTTVPLYTEEYTVVCREDAALAENDSIDWSDLKGLRLCLLPPDMQNRRIVNRNLLEAGVDPMTTVESNSTTVLVSHVAHSGAVTILPTDLAEFLTEGKHLKAIPIRAHQRGYDVGLIAPYREPHTPVLRALLGKASKASRYSAQPGQTASSKAS